MPIECVPPKAHRPALSSSGSTGPRLLFGALVASLGLAAAPAAAQHRASEAWASSSGSTGAGLGLVSPQGGRFWGEAAFHTQDGLTAFSPLLGIGFFITPNIELEGILPLSFASVEFGNETESSLRLGAPYFGVNYVHDDGRRLRLKVGSGLAYNPAEPSAAGWVALIAGEAMRGRWDLWLWTDRQLNLAAPFRLEYDLSPAVVFGVDAGFDLMIPVSNDNDEDGDVNVQVAPGIGFRAGQHWVVGGRLAAVFIPTADGDGEEQFSLEPYVRGAWGAGFFLARLTMNIDEPYGFAFEEDEIWGLHVGGGLAW